MALTPANPGDRITSTAWNSMITEINGKVTKTGDIMTGPLTVNNAINAGTSEIYFTKTDHVHSGFGNTLGFAAIENSANFDGLMILGRTTVATNGLRKVRLYDYLEVNGNLDVRGALSTRSLTIATADNSGSGMSISRSSNSITPNNFDISLGFSGFFFPGAAPLSYRFRVGHGRLVFGGQEPFFTSFSINEAGNATFAGSKGGYVVDFFVNRVGDTIEEGDVIVVGEQTETRYYGRYNNIPIPEIDLTEKAYDTRVCGIVATVIAEADLPPIDFEHIAIESGEMQRHIANTEGVSNEAPSEPTQVMPHPFQEMGAKMTESFNRRLVGPNQMGQMVTLGAFAHCKVDADIAPIKAGDLLTTSPTKGHAQKVLDPKKATGAIIGKALASLEKGKGKIPIMVLMQ